MAETFINPFAGRVGLKYTDAPDVPVWVDSLPGMSVEMAGSLRAEDAQALWERMQPVAVDKIMSQIEALLSKDATFNHLLARTSNDLPRPLTDAILYPSTVPDPALLVSAVCRAEHASLKLGTLSFYSQVAESIAAQVIIRHLDGEELDTLDHTVVKGMNRVVLDKTYPLTTAETILEVELVAGNDLILRTLEPNGTTDDYTLLVATSNYGTGDTMHLKASVTCDFARVMEQYGKTLQWAYAYQCAAQLLDEKLSSNLMNVFTNTNRIDTLDRIKQYGKEVSTRLATAANLILRDLESVGSPYISTDPDDQGGVYIGSYV